MAALALLASPAAAVEVLPVPASFADVSAGADNVTGHLFPNDVHWYRLQGNASVRWIGTIWGNGSLGFAGFYVQDALNSSRMLAVKNGYLWGGSLGNQTMTWLFSGDLPYYFSFRVLATSPTLPPDGNYTFSGSLQPIRELVPGVPLVSSPYQVGDGSSSSPDEPLYYGDEAFRLYAEAHSEVSLRATLGEVRILPSHGIPGFFFFASMGDIPHGGYEQFPLSWWRYPPFSENSEFWASQRLNLTHCIGNPCTAVSRFVAPYTGWYDILLGPAGGPVDMDVSIEASVVAERSLDGNDGTADAPPVGHSPEVRGNLSAGLDVEDWFALDLAADVGLGVTLTVDDRNRAPDGTPYSWYELAVLAPGGRSAIVVGSTPMTANFPLAVGFQIPHQSIETAGVYLVKVTVLGGWKPMVIDCTSGACGPGYNQTSESFATYRVTFALPNEGPAALPPGPMTGREDETFSLDLSSFFSDPEGDPLSYRVLAAPAQGSAVIVGSNLSAWLAPDAWGNISVGVEAADWFGATSTATIAIHFAPVDDAPRANTTRSPLRLSWDQANSSGPIHFDPFLFDPDGDPLVLAFHAPAAVANATCGPMCAEFRGASEEVVGFFSFNVTARDPAGASALFRVDATIVQVNRRPHASAGAQVVRNLSATGPAVLVFTSALCHDPDGDAVFLAVVGTDAPAGGLAELDLGGNGVWLNASTEALVGLWTVTVACSDAGGPGAAFAFTTRVLAPNHAPAVVSHVPSGPLWFSVPENSSFDLAAEVLDPDGDALAFAWSLDGITAPALGTDNSTIAFFGFEAAGLHAITLTAADAHGASLEVVWHIDVLNVDRPPTCAIAAIESRDGPAGELLNLRGEGSDPDGDPVDLVWELDAVGAGTGSTLIVARPLGEHRFVLRVTSGNVESECALQVIGTAPQGPPPASAEWLLPAGLLAVAAALALISWRRRRDK